MTADRATQREAAKRRETRAGAYALGLVAILAIVLPLLLALASADPSSCAEGAGLGAVSSAALGAHRWFSGERIVRLDLLAPALVAPDGGRPELAPVACDPAPSPHAGPAAPLAAAQSRRF